MDKKSVRVVIKKIDSGEPPLYGILIDPSEQSRVGYNLLRLWEHELKALHHALNQYYKKGKKPDDEQGNTNGK